jgi:hypothetical protein
MVIIVLVKNVVPLSFLLVASASATTSTSAAAPFASAVAPLILLWRAGRALFFLVWGIRDFASWNENSTLVHGGGCHLTSTSCHGMLGWGPQAVSHKLYQASSGM